MLNHWISQAREHWKEHQPTRFKKLSKAGKLGLALRDAAERTHREMSSLEEQGYREFEAWEIVRERYLFPPQESGVEEDEDNPAARLSMEIAALHSEILRLAHEPDEDL